MAPHGPLCECRPRPPVRRDCAGGPRARVGWPEARRAAVRRPRALCGSGTPWRCGGGGSVSVRDRGGGSRDGERVRLRRRPQQLDHGLVPLWLLHSALPGAPPCGARRVSDDARASPAPPTHLPQLAPSPLVGVGHPVVGHRRYTVRGRARRGRKVRMKRGGRQRAIARKRAGAPAFTLSSCHVWTTSVERAEQNALAPI